VTTQCESPGRQGPGSLLLGGVSQEYASICPVSRLPFWWISSTKEYQASLPGYHRRDFHTPSTGLGH
jgi:hypothetical protein